MEFFSLGIGLLVGAIIAWLIASYLYGNKPRQISEEEIQQKYVLREIHDHLQNQADLLRDDLSEKEKEIRDISSQLASREQNLVHLEDKLINQKSEISKLEERFQVEFENIANRLLEEKSQKFSQQNQLQLSNILNPLKEKIKTFEEGIERRYIEETRDKISLKKEIEQLRDLNMQLSQDANNLASALKGENKTQGDWGELQLETLLEKSGLKKGIHYKTQTSYKDQNGQIKRPDFIIILPENKHLIIDSKVSLVAYEKCFTANDEAEKKRHLKAHVDSLKNHIKDLSSKNYQQLYQINTPDYLLLFVPIEPAFSLAVQNDQRLFLDALDRNIVIVTTSTLLATMRTVSFIWKQEKQKRSVLEIARQSGLLYDKFVNFVEDLRNVGHRLDSAQKAYHDAMNKMTEGQRKGDTLIGRAQKIKELGAKASKNLPSDIIDQIESE